MLIVKLKLMRDEVILYQNHAEACLCFIMNLVFLMLFLISVKIIFLIKKFFHILFVGLKNNRNWIFRLQLFFNRLRLWLPSGSILLLPCIIYFLAYAGLFQGKTSYINFVLYEKYYFLKAEEIRCLHQYVELWIQPSINKKVSVLG